MTREIRSHLRGKVRLIGLCDQNLFASRRLSRQFHPPVPIFSPREIFAKSQLVIEAASPEALGTLLPLALRYRRPMMVLSAGGLLQFSRILRKLMALRIPIHLPSGALVGLDGIKAGKVGGLKRVTLTTRKPPQAFKGAPGLRGTASLQKRSSPKVLFEGSADQAVKAFPLNVNVAATLALAGLGAHRTWVRVIADPKARTNIHELEAEGHFGRILCRTENRPSRENPKTSRLAADSAVALLRRLTESLQVGT